MADLWPTLIGLSKHLALFSELINDVTDFFCIFFVALITVWRRGIICYVVSADFLISLIVASWLSESAYWDDRGIFWQYALAIKDTLIMSALFMLRANPLVTLSYGVASVLCWALWFVFERVESDNIYYLAWYLWLPMYLLAQVLQVAALGFKGGDDGRLARARLYARWSGRYVSVSNAVHSYISAGKGGVHKDQGKMETKA